MNGIKLPVRVDFTLDEQPLIDADGDMLCTEEIAAVIFGALCLLSFWATIVAASFGLWGVPIGCVSFMAACVLGIMARDAFDFATSKGEGADAQGGENG